MSREAETDSIDGAAARLNRVLEQLAVRVSQLQSQALAESDHDQLLADRARLAEELDEARTRAALMEDAAHEAGKALDAAIAEVQAVLQAGAS